MNNFFHSKISDIMGFCAESRESQALSHWIICKLNLSSVESDDEIRDKVKSELERCMVSLAKGDNEEDFLFTIACIGYMKACKLVDDLRKGGKFEVSFVHWQTLSVLSVTAGKKEENEKSGNSNGNIGYAGGSVFAGQSDCKAKCNAM